MPTSTEILSGLAAIANDWIAVAVAWHVAVAVALAAIAIGWRPHIRTARLLIAALPASVAIAALVHGNPFNGIVFAGATVLLISLALRDRVEAPLASPLWARWAGGAMIAFGWLYPHFLVGDPWRYLYAAPLGLVPCPTLSMAIGLALLVPGGRRAWSLTLASIGVFYALFGALRLGVLIDFGLLAGALALAVLATTAIRSKWRPRASLPTESGARSRELADRAR